jgi:hypothetical protein
LLYIAWFIIRLLSKLAFRFPEDIHECNRF